MNPRYEICLKCLNEQTERLFTWTMMKLKVDVAIENKSETWANPFISFQNKRDISFGDYAKICFDCRYELEHMILSKHVLERLEQDEQKI